MKIKVSLYDKDLIGSRLPRWYGFAYRDHEIRKTILYIIPLNLVVRYAMWLYWLGYRWVKFEGWQDKLDYSYLQGYNDGNTTKDHHFDRLARIIQGKEV